MYVDYLENPALNYGRQINMIVSILSLDNGTVYEITTGIYSKICYFLRDCSNEIKMCTELRLLSSTADVDIFFSCYCGVSNNGYVFRTMHNTVR